jgi:glycosyltransferase involved in cell wall biosynthesis
MANPIRVEVCTIVARNYLAFARVLARSLRLHHPDWRLTALVVDPDGGSATEPFRTVGLESIGLPERERHLLPLIYDVTEFATAVKPWLLESLLADGADAVLYLDPDIRLFSPITRLAELAAQHGAVLTPHCLDPVPRDGLAPSETDLLWSGVYNLGFAGIGPQSGPMLSWWQARLRRESLIDPENARFVDQRWMDFAPAMFPGTVFRGRGYNVAYWNLQERDLQREGDAFRVGDEPLAFFHYSGFDPRRPHLLSKHLGPVPRILLGERPAVRDACALYARELFEAGFAEAIRLPYPYARTAGGVTLDRPTRRALLEEVLRADAGGGDFPPDAFAPESGPAFAAWLAQPTRLADGTPCSRALAIEYRRAVQVSPAPVLEELLPTIRALREPRRAVPVALIPDLHVNDSPPPRIPGVTVAGFFNAELGLGESARMLHAALVSAGIPCGTVGYRHTQSRQDHPFDADAKSEARTINAIMLTADALPRFRREMGEPFFAGAWNVGYWFWETTKIPARMHRAFDLVDEVWVGSEFVRAALARHTDKPVRLMPLPFCEPGPLTPDRAALGLPDGRFLFLTVFDYFSVLERKNPVGLVRAFKRAFRPGEGPVLVLKSINGERRTADRERVRFEADGHPDILFLDRYLDARQTWELTACCDCSVSLHRSEGLGMTLAQAMWLGKPAIATAYSGNLDFMTPENSLLCPYTLVPVGGGQAPYPASAEWAEPDLDAAAELMRRVAGDPALRETLGRRAAADIRATYAPERCLPLLSARVAEIEAAVAARGDAAGPAAAERDDLGRLRDQLKRLGKAGGGGLRRKLGRWLLKDQQALQADLHKASARAIDQLARQVRDQRREFETRLDRLQDRMTDDTP